MLKVLLSKETLNGTKFHLARWNLDILQEPNVCSYHYHFVSVMYVIVISLFYMAKRQGIDVFVENKVELKTVVSKNAFAKFRSMGKSTKP